MTDKVNDLLEIEARMTTRQVARSLSISTGSAFKILKKKLGVSRIAARWIPHLLTDGQKRDRVSIARKLLKKYPQFNRGHFLIFGQPTKHGYTSTSPPENVATKYGQPKM